MKIINLFLLIAIIGVGVVLTFLFMKTWRSGNSDEVIMQTQTKALIDEKNIPAAESDKNLNKEVDKAIEKAIDFLVKEQNANGGFSLCVGNNLQDCQYKEQPPILTAQILISLRNVSGGEKLASLASKAVNFLSGLDDESGLWRFFHHLPPDLDDTSVVSLALLLYDKNFVSNIDHIMSARNDSGIFETWILNGDVADSDHSRVSSIKLSSRDLIQQDTDCVVNANVLAYLAKANFAKNEVTRPICDYLRANVINQQSSCSPYYPSRLALFYSISRMTVSGVSCVSDGESAIIKEIVKSFNQKDGSFGSEMETALAVNTLLAFSYQGGEVEKAIAYLLKIQDQYGGFDGDIMFNNGEKVVYFSPSFSTAIAAEAFMRYKNEKISR